MELTNEFLLTAAHYKMIVLYVVFLLVTIIDRKVTSMTVTIIVILLHEYFSDAIFDSLYKIASKDGISFKFAWYGTWTFVNMISIYLIYYLHSRLQLRITHAAYFYSCLLLMYSAAQFIDFFDRATFNSGFFAEMYQISIFSGNMVMPFLLTAFWLNDKRLRKSVYTKAVK